MKKTLKTAIILRLSFFTSAVLAQQPQDRIPDTSGVTSMKIHFLHG